MLAFICTNKILTNPANGNLCLAKQWIELDEIPQVYPNRPILQRKALKNDPKDVHGFSELFILICGKGVCGFH